MQEKQLISGLDSIGTKHCPFMLKKVKKNDCASLLKQFMQFLYRSFCMKIIQILCQFQAFKCSGSSTKKAIASKFGLE